MTLRKLGSARLTGRSAQADYLANSAAISLTVGLHHRVTMDSESCSKGLQMMTLFAFWTFLSMIVMVPAFYFSRYWQKIVIAVMWTPMLLPVRNAIRYYSVVRKIRSNWTQKLDLNMTFPGPAGRAELAEKLNKTHSVRPRKKGTQGALDKDLRTFVVKEKDPEDPKKPFIKLNPHILSPGQWRRPTRRPKGAGTSPGSSGRGEPPSTAGSIELLRTDNARAAIDHDAATAPPAKTEARPDAGRMYIGAPPKPYPRSPSTPTTIHPRSPRSTAAGTSRRSRARTARTGRVYHGRQPLHEQRREDATEARAIRHLRREGEEQRQGQREHV